MRYKIISRVLFLSVFFTAAFSFIYSQDFGDERRKQPDGERRWDRIEEFKKLKMIEELNLSEDESVKFYTKYNTMTNQFKEIEKEKRKAIAELDKILNDPGKTAELEKKVDYIVGLEQKALGNRINFMSEVKKILSLEKVARYIIFERNFQRELENIVKDVRKQPPPMER
jgi:hypothetical protein